MEDETQARTLLIGLGGSDTLRGASWLVGAVPPWLSVPQVPPQPNERGTVAARM